LLKAGKLPASVAYAVVSVRRGGEKSPLSNFAVLAPAVPPGPPVFLAVTPEEGRICLEWLAPSTDMLGQPVETGGYFVYRRVLPEEEYEAPINAKPVAGTAFVDAGAPYGQLVYTLRAILPNKPKVEGAPADEAALDYRDVFPPPAPARLDALPEAGLVRLVWDPSPAPDLAGYLVFRAEGAGKPERLNPEPIKDSFMTDTSAKPGHRYRYLVRAVDKAGNLSAPSPEATAEPL
jgi:predicted phage tail protein